MGLVDENLNAEIELCYKVLGLSFSDPPERIEMVFNGLKEKCVREMRSSDLAVRKNASQELQQLEELYKSITESLVYRDYAREYEKQSQTQKAAKQDKLQKKRSDKVLLITCHYCNKLFVRSFKKCPYCNKRQPLSLASKIAIVSLIILAIIAIGVALLLIRGFW